MTFVTIIVLIIPITYFLSKQMLAVAIRKHILDIPNSRSSHQVPTPRGGGAAFSLVIISMSLTGCCTGWLSFPVALAVAVGGAGVALVGWIDDKRGLSIRTRFAVHGFAALWITVWVGRDTTLNLGFTEIAWGNLGLIFFVLGGIWLINLYNFMDGIDGLAAAEAITAGLAGCAILWGTSGDVLALSTGAAVLGFIPWNWPQARLFMGDVGSGFLGLVFACLWMCGSDIPGGFFIWPVLLGVFIVDATLTLLGRMHRREKWYASHRSHAYQVAALRWGHGAVTKAVVFMNIFWLAPCAIVCRVYPGWAGAVMVGAYLPLVALYICIKRKCL